MPLLLTRNDIVKIHADAIVNPSNPHLRQGSGTSRAIFLAAGEEQLTEACSRIGYCPVGKAVLTPAFQLPAGYIIHAVCPAWRDEPDEDEELLYRTYTEVLQLAVKHDLQTVAFPLLSSGNYRFPKETAFRIAVRAISDFLTKYDMTVWLVLYDRESVSVSMKLFASVEEYINDHYVEEKDESFPRHRSPEDRSGAGEYRTGTQLRSKDTVEDGLSEDLELAPLQKESKELKPQSGWEEPPWARTGAMPPRGRADKASSERAKSAPSPGDRRMAAAPMQGSRAPEESKSKTIFGGLFASMRAKKDLDERIQHMEETFSQKLLRLIDERGRKDSEVYRRANIDRRHFSKIKSNVNYAPNKRTVLAFAVALELSLDETQELLKCAGFAFSDSALFDVIVRYFIEYRMYDIYTINEVLFAYGEQILC